MHILRAKVPRPHLQLLESERQLQVELSFCYDDALPPTPYDGSSFALQRFQGEHYYIHRHPAEEDRVARFLTACGLTRARVGLYTSFGEKAFSFLLQQVPRLIQAGWQIDGLDRLRHFHIDFSPPRLTGHVTALRSDPSALGQTPPGAPSTTARPSQSSRPTFQLALNLQLQDTTIHGPALMRLIQSGERLVALPRGGHAYLSDEVSEKLSVLRSLTIAQSDGHLQFDKSAALALASIFAPPEPSPGTALPPASGEGTALALEGDATWQVTRERLAKLLPQGGHSAFPLRQTPHSFKGLLRPYQQQGLTWLVRLREAGVGGILADDMGLGKTIQVLSLLALERDEASDPSRHLPTLIITPTSVVDNWASEARRFVPHLRVLVLTGSGRRKLESKIPESDIILSSYSLLRRDLDWLLPYTFFRIVLDEGQYIKNHDSQTARCVKRLHATHRLTLSGTPIENRLEELWSQFAFLMPKLLGSLETFKLRYGTVREPLPPSGAPSSGASSIGASSSGTNSTPPSRPLQSFLQPSDLRSTELALRVKPFLLRRLKSEVAQELPPRTEILWPCELDPRQRRIYLALLGEWRDEVLKKVDREGITASRFSLLTLLLRLRQVCCDPMLLKAAPELPASVTPLLKGWEESGASPAKLDALFERLEEAIEGGHRVLVFSQFVRMLERIRTELEHRNLRFEYLDGHTGDRLQRVERFNQSDTPIFLLSLKAGGTGLNLTGADYVIHFDPWWNPAVEAQATDRTHRIGQLKPVFSYKLIARDTIEDRILDLQSRKKVLAEGILAPRETLLASLTLDDLRYLLEAR